MCLQYFLLLFLLCFTLYCPSLVLHNSFCITPPLTPNSSPVFILMLTIATRGIVLKHSCAAVPKLFLNSVGGNLII